MSIQIRITQDWIARCDHCGTFADIHRPTTHEAIQAAVEEGFKYTQWVQDNCPRELLLCPECHEKALTRGKNK